MWSTKAIEDIRRELGSNLNLGITNEEAKERLKKYGLKDADTHISPLIVHMERNRKIIGNRQRGGFYS